MLAAENQELTVGSGEFDVECMHTRLQRVHLFLEPFNGHPRDRQLLFVGGAATTPFTAAAATATASAGAASGAASGAPTATVVMVLCLGRWRRRRRRIRRRIRSESISAKQTGQHCGSGLKIAR